VCTSAATSRASDPCLEKDQELVREEARDLMKHIQDKCVEYDPDRKVRLPLSFSGFPFNHPSSSRSFLNLSQVGSPQLSIG